MASEVLLRNPWGELTAFPQTPWLVVRGLHTHSPKNPTPYFIPSGFVSSAFWASPLSGRYNNRQSPFQNPAYAPVMVFSLSLYRPVPISLTAMIILMYGVWSDPSFSHKEETKGKVTTDMYVSLSDFYSHTTDMYASPSDSLLKICDVKFTLRYLGNLPLC